MKEAYLDIQRVGGVSSYLFLLYLDKKKDALGIDEALYVKTIRFLITFFVRRNMTDVPPTRDVTRMFMAHADIMMLMCICLWLSTLVNIFTVEGLSLSASLILKSSQVKMVTIEEYGCSLFVRYQIMMLKSHRYLLQLEDMASLGASGNFQVEK